MLRLPKLPAVLSKRIPVHIAVNTSRIKPWMRINEKTLQEAMVAHTKLLNLLLEWQQKRDVPVLSVRVSPKKEEEYTALTVWFQKLSEDDAFLKSSTRVFVIGDWYGVKPELIDAIKLLMEKTKDYDKKFVNILLNYDGQEELVRAIEVIVRKILANKLKLEEVNKESIKESLYSSNFVPPELIIECSRKYSGVLLWDAKNALTYFSEKYWLDFDKGELDAALEFYAKDKKEEEKEVKHESRQE